jgi:hypothetical protein
MPRLARWWCAIVLLLVWAAPARAALFAQADESTPILEYGVALGATALVLAVVCWPARRNRE